MGPILEPSAPPPPPPSPPLHPSSATSAPPPPPPPPPNEPINIRPNAHIRPLHLPHLPDYGPTTSTQPPSPPPNHYHNHHYPPIPPQNPSSPSSENTSASLPLPPRPAPQPAPEKQVTKTSNQTNLPKPAVAKHESHPLCYIFLGALLALFFNVFAFLFLCCPSGMGIHGRRRPNFVAGVVIGALINAAAIACIYFFVVRPIVDDL